MAGGIKLQVDLDMAKFQTQLNSLVSKANGTVVSPKVNTDNVSKYTKGIKSATVATESLGQKVLDIPLKFFKWYAISGVVTGAFGAVKDGVADVISLDAALTNISFTMELTSSELNSIADNSNMVANSLASTSNKVLEATQIYSNMNETLGEINDKSQASIILSNITGESITDMANAVQGSVYAFDLQADAASHVADVMSKIAASTGVAFNQSVKSMTDSISVAGGVANEVGLSFEQFASIVATTQEKTRMSGTKIASGLTTVFSRITRVSELGAEEISKLEGGFKELGITIRDKTTGEFLDMWEILQNINDVWGDLSSTERSYVAELSAGVRQRKVFLGVLNSMEGITSRASEAMISSGFAMEQNDKFVESLTGKLNLLSEAQSRYFRVLIDSGEVGSVIDSFTSFFNILTKIASISYDLNIGTPALFASLSVGLTMLSTKIAILNGVVSLSNPIFAALTAVLMVGGFVYDKHSKKIKEIAEQTEKAKIAQEQYNKVMSSGSDKDIDNLNNKIARLAIEYENATKALYSYNSAHEDINNTGLFRFKELSEDIKQTKSELDAYNLSQEELNKLVSEYTNKINKQLVDDLKKEADERHGVTSVVKEQIKGYYDLLESENALKITRELTLEQLEELSNAYPEAMESLIDAEVSATNSVLEETQKRIIAKKLEIEAIQSLNAYSSKEDTIKQQHSDYAFFRKNLDIIDESRERLEGLNSVKEKYFETSKSSTSSVGTSISSVSILENQVIALSEVNRQINLLESNNNKTIEQEKELKSLYNDKLNALSELADLYREQAKELDPLSKEYDDLQNTINGLSVEYNTLEAKMLDVTDTITEQKEVLKDLVSDAQEDLINAIEDEISALEDKRDSLTEEYEIRKDINSEIDAQIEYEKKLASYDKSISKVKLERQMLLLDNSVEANARREDLSDELLKYEEDKQDLIYERENDLRDDRLEDEYNAEKDLIEDKIDLNEDMLDDIKEQTTKILDDIGDASSDEIDDLLDNFITFDEKYSDSLTGTIGSTWDTLISKLQDYADILAGLSNVEISLPSYDMSSKSMVKTSSSSGYDVGTAPTYSGSSSSSSSKSSSSKSSSSSSSLSNMSTSALKKSIASASSVGISATNEKAELASRGIKYHDGLMSGAVGSSGISGLKEREIATVLEKGEHVIDNEQYNNMGNILESTGLISGNGISSSMSKISNINTNTTSNTFGSLITINKMENKVSSNVDAKNIGVNMAKGVEKELANKGIIIPSMG